MGAINKAQPMVLGLMLTGALTAGPGVAPARGQVGPTPNAGPHFGHLNTVRPPAGLGALRGAAAGAGQQVSGKTAFAPAPTAGPGLQPGPGGASGGRPGAELFGDKGGFGEADKAMGLITKSGGPGGDYPNPDGDPVGGDPGSPPDTCRPENGGCVTDPDGNAAPVADPAGGMVDECQRSGCDVDYEFGNPLDDAAGGIVDLCRLGVCDTDPPKDGKGGNTGGEAGGDGAVDPCRASITCEAGGDSQGETDYDDDDDCDKSDDSDRCSQSSGSDDDSDSSGSGSQYPDDWASDSGSDCGADRCSQNPDGSSSAVDPDPESQYPGYGSGHGDSQYGSDPDKHQGTPSYPDMVYCNSFSFHPGESCDQYHYTPGADEPYEDETVCYAGTVCMGSQYPPDDTDVGTHYLAHASATDFDGDELPNATEDAGGTDPNSWDTDKDGVGDGYELLISHTNPRNWDSDGDGASDDRELACHSDPNDASSQPGRCGVSHQ